MFQCVNAIVIVSFFQQRVLYPRDHKKTNGPSFLIVINWVLSEARVLIVRPYKWLQIHKLALLPLALDHVAARLTAFLTGESR